MTKASKESKEKKDAKTPNKEAAAAKDGKDAKSKTPAGGTKDSKDGKGATQGSQATNVTNPSQIKFASARAKKEVEENPFKKLIDISDLMELEGNPDETLKEIQNCLLRHNSELKQWYKVYSRKIEVTKSEESFAMTLKQVWRFLRDNHLVSANSTLAQFDRVYNQGSKNHFLLLGSKDEEKFNKIYKAAQQRLKDQTAQV